MMPFPLRDREDATLDQLAAVLANADMHLAGTFCAVLRHVLVRTSRGEWENFGTVLKLLDASSESEFSRRRVDMRAVKLLSRPLDLLSITDSQALQAALGSWRGEMGSTKESTWQETSRASRWPSRSNFAPEPSWVFELHEQGEGGGYSGPDGPFISAEHGLFAESIGPLAAAWLRDPAFANEHQVRNQYKLIFPDARARISDLFLDSHCVRVHVDQRDPELKLFCGAAATSYADERMDFLAPVVGSLATLEFARDPKTLRMWIVAPDGEWLDRYDEGPYHASWGERILGAGLSAPEAGDLKSAVTLGEGPTLEFKEWIPMKPQGKKSAELLKTVVAFSNSGGGDLYIGVDDHAAVVRILPALQEEYGAEARGNLACMQDAYIRDLSKMVTDRIAPKVRPDFTWIDYGGLPVLRVRVSKGAELPYAIADAGDVYVRKGATDRKADPSELRLLLARQDHTIL